MAFGRKNASRQNVNASGLKSQTNPKSYTGLLGLRRGYLHFRGGDEDQTWWYWYRLSGVKVERSVIVADNKVYSHGFPTKESKYTVFNAINLRGHRARSFLLLRLYAQRNVRHRSHLATIRQPGYDTYSTKVYSFARKNAAGRNLNTSDEPGTLTP